MPIHSTVLTNLRRTGLVDSSRAELVATGLLLLAGAVAFIGPAVLGLDGPKAAARAYLTGQARSDASAVRAVADVRSDGPLAADATLLDDAALRAFLGAQAAHPTSIQVDEPNTSANQASVTAIEHFGAKTQEIALTLRRVYPLARIHGTWKVRVQPAILHVQLPAGAGDLTVDDRPVRLPSGKPARVALFPGLHRLSLTGGKLIGAHPITFNPAAVSAPPSIPLELTTEGREAAGRAVRAAFAKCAAISEPDPKACPQVFTFLGTRAVTWTLVGDPSAPFEYKIEPATGRVGYRGSTE